MRTAPRKTLKWETPRPVPGRLRIFTLAAHGFVLRSEWNPIYNTAIQEHEKPGNLLLWESNFGGMRCVVCQNPSMVDHFRRWSASWADASRFPVQNHAGGPERAAQANQGP